MNGCFGLTDTHGLDKDIVIAGRLAEHDSFASLASHATKRSCRGGRADKGIGMLRKFLHASLIAEDRTLSTLARGVDGEYGEFATLLEDVEAKDIDRSRLAGTRHTGDADAARIAGIWKALLDNLLGYLLMCVYGRLDESHSLPQHGDITLEDTLHIFAGSEQATSRHRTTIGVNTGL